VQRGLSSAEVDEIVNQHACGVTINDLGRTFDIHRTTVMSHLDDRNVLRRQIPQDDRRTGRAVTAQAFP